MILKGLINSNIYKIISKDVALTKSGAFLLYSKDKILNEMMAKLIAFSILCGKQTPCFNCDNCKRNELEKHPDLIVVDKDSILVGDISQIIDSCQLKPMLADRKVILIMNAEKMNENAQNKLLKTLEEPPESVNFILTTCNTNKLLTTIISRCKKHNLIVDDFSCVAEELNMNSDAPKINKLSELFGDEQAQLKTMLDKIVQLFTNLEKTSDIPSLVSKLDLNQDEKQKFLVICEDLFYNLLRYLTKTEYNKFYQPYFEQIQFKFNQKVLIAILKVIDEANRAYVANVNFNYVLDIMLYEILKEKHLCK